MVPPVENLATGGGDALRARVEALLRGGLETEWAERAYTSEAVNSIATRLRSVARDDLRAKLVVAGFTMHPYESEEISQSCETCMYYLIHRKYCELPEIGLPVEPQWACRLWRI